MDRESKITIGILIFLFGVAGLLLKLAAGVHFFSLEFVSGFLPFALLLSPYILFSSNYFVALLRDYISSSVIKKLYFPTYLLLIYAVFSVLASNFQWPLFLTLSIWLYLPSLIFGTGFIDVESITLREFSVVVLLWMPIELGLLSGFEIIFSRDISIPALPFAAPALGLYLFAVLRNLPDIGFTFQWRFKDLSTVILSLSLLALILIPFGVHSGFIHFSLLDVSFIEVLKLLFGIYFLVAVPEELLFRGIIQNLLSKILTGSNGKWHALTIGSIIFGLSHWNNFSPPDWRYVFLATVAGLFYGFTYMKTGKTTLSALVHCGVNLFWAICFKDTPG